MTQLLKNKWVWVLIVVAVAAGFFRSLQSKSLEITNIGKVTKGSVIHRVTISGNVTPNRKTIISAPYNGYVRKIYVQVGDHIHAGDPVISLAQSLRASSEDVYPLRAPFEGTVVQVLRTEGEYVEQPGTTAGNALVRIDDLTHMFVEAEAPEVEVSRLKVGQEVLIKASAILTRSYKGLIRHIALAAREQKDWDRSRVEFSVLIEVTDADSQLKPGMTVVGDIITNKVRHVLTLRQEFVQKDGEQYFVVTETGQRKSVEVGMQNEEVFEIKSGLTEGERIRQTDFLSLVKDD